MSSIEATWTFAKVNQATVLPCALLFLWFFFFSCTLWLGVFYGSTFPHRVCEGTTNAISRHPGKENVNGGEICAGKRQQLHQAQRQQQQSPQQQQPQPEQQTASLPKLRFFHYFGKGNVSDPGRPSWFIGIQRSGSLLGVGFVVSSVVPNDEEIHQEKCEVVPQQDGSFVSGAYIGLKRTSMLC